MSQTLYGVNVADAMKIRNKKGYGVSVAAATENGIETACAGSARFGQDFPVAPDTLFQAGSVSKPAFALTLLRYVDRGIIDPDADISGAVRDFVKIPVTFSALLSHTAGFNLHGFPGYRADAPLLSPEDVLAGRGVTPKLRRILPYGKQYSYSGGGITLAELAFTRITGVSLQEAFQKEVAGPLGLTRTGYFQPLDEKFSTNAAFGGRLGLREDPACGWHYYPEHAAAGLWTTPTELCKLGLALSESVRNGGFLKKETARRMVTPVLETYGLCVHNFRGDIALHGGENEGFLTMWMVSLREDLCVTVMVNRSDSRADEAMTDLAIELFQTAEDRLSENADKTGWEAYCGRYEQRIEDFRLDEVFLRNGDLYARIENEEGGFVSKLYPIGERTFGRIGGFAKIEFGDGCFTLDGVTCKKI